MNRTIMMGKIILLGIALLLVTACGPELQRRPATGLKETNHHKVIVLVVDSLMSHSLEQATRDEKYPAIRFLMKRGHYFPKIIASFPSMTVSDVSTILTGVYPEEHRIPGLVWIDVNHDNVMNYGNNLSQSLVIGPRVIVRNALHELNQSHLSKNVRTVFEDLQDAGFTTGAINLLVYRGKTSHQLVLPVYARPFSNARAYEVQAPDTFIFGQLTTQSNVHAKRGILNQFGLNDDFSTQSLLYLMKANKLPDFTMVYMPDNDSILHKHGPGEMKGIEQVEKNVQKVLSAYRSWDDTLQHVTLVVMGDGGVTPVLPVIKYPTIMLGNLFPKQSIYHWGRSIRPKDDIGFAVNSRMAYVYLLSPRISKNEALKQLLNEKRIDLVAWPDGNTVSVTSPDDKDAQLKFRKEGRFKDPYGVTWDIHGTTNILDIKMKSNHLLTYGRYPDALHQLWSAMHSQDGNYFVVTAKKGYQFGDENAPLHNQGAQQASLLAEDVFAPLLINGSECLPVEPIRFVDLKRYFVTLVQESSHKREN